MGSPGPGQPLTARVVEFLAVLRRAGFLIGPADAVDALAVVGAGPRPIGEMRRRLKVLLSCRERDWDRFDDLFDRFWLSSLPLSASAADPPGASLFSPQIANRETGGAAGPEALTETVPSSSERAGPPGVAAADAATRKDLSDLADPREMAAAERIARRVTRSLRRHSRRRQAKRSGTGLDLRRMIRASLGRGGEPLDLRRRRRRVRPARIVILLDVSGSMRPYSPFLLQFAAGLIRQDSSNDAYLMHSRLVRVSDELGERDPARAMQRLSTVATGFGGGTRLARSLQTFNDIHATRTLNRHAVVIVASDGYESGSADALAAELVRIRKRAGPLVWLNPLLARRDYRPTTLAMLAALPHVDHFAPANNLEALASLERDLARL